MADADLAEAGSAHLSEQVAVPVPMAGHALRTEEGLPAGKADDHPALAACGPGFAYGGKRYARGRRHEFGLTRV